MGALELQAEASYVQAQMLKKKYGKSRNIKKSNKHDTEFKDGEAKPEHATSFGNTGNCENIISYVLERVLLGL